MSPFAVDLEEMLLVVGRLGRCGDELDDLLDSLATDVAALHLTWAGLTADAQAAAQRDWEAGFRAMREGLGRMRAAAATAHGNYDAAVTANQAMWGQLS